MGQESSEFVDQNVLNLIGLLDLDADTNTVYTWLYKDSLVLISRNRQWVQQNLWGSLGLNLWNIVSFGGLRCEIRQA